MSTKLLQFSKTAISLKYIDTHIHIKQIISNIGLWKNRVKESFAFFLMNSCIFFPKFIHWEYLIFIIKKNKENPLGEVNYGKHLLIRFHKFWSASGVISSWKSLNLISGRRSSVPEIIRKVLRTLPPESQ